MWSFLLSTLVKELIGAILKMASDYMKLKKKKKEDRESVNDALKEKDPKLRAKRVRDLLS